MFPDEKFKKGPKVDMGSKKIIKHNIFMSNLKEDKAKQENLKQKADAGANINNFMLSINSFSITNDQITLVINNLKAVTELLTKNEFPEKKQKALVSAVYY